MQETGQGGFLRSLKIVQQGLQGLSFSLKKKKTFEFFLVDASHRTFFFCYILSLPYER